MEVKEYFYTHYCLTYTEYLFPVFYMELEWNIVQNIEMIIWPLF
jgi:hypothetical protein